MYTNHRTSRCDGMVDVTDSKSVGLIPRVGSSPTTGTTSSRTLYRSRRLFMPMAKKSSLTHAVAPPSRNGSRLLRLCPYKRWHYASAALPTRFGFTVLKHARKCLAFRRFRAFLYFCRGPRKSEGHGHFPRFTLHFWRDIGGTSGVTR